MSIFKNLTNRFANIGAGGNFFQAPMEFPDEAARQKASREGFQNFANALGVVAAIQSGNPQRLALAQQNMMNFQERKREQEDERKALENFNRMYATLDEDQQREVDLQRAGIKLPANNQTFERFGVYGLDGKPVGSVSKSNTQKIQEIENNPNFIIAPLSTQGLGQEDEPLNIYSVTDADGNRIGQIANPTIENLDDLTAQGLFLNKLPQASDRGQGVPKFPGLNDLQGQFKATNKLVSNISGLAKKFAESPKSALALGNVTQFVDSIISNIDAAGNMLQGEDYNSVQQQGYVSNGGKDYSNAIKTVSQATGIAESRVRDLAYLFAAARGQEGRGLSDKDYDNALTIVSGGVGAEGKIKVLEDVANRLTEEAYGDLNFIIGQLPPGTDPARYNQLTGSIQPFVNPYNNQSAVPLNQADQILKDLGID